MTSYHNSIIQECHGFSSCPPHPTPPPPAWTKQCLNSCCKCPTLQYVKLLLVSLLEKKPSSHSCVWLCHQNSSLTYNSKPNCLGLKTVGFWFLVLFHCLVFSLFSLFFCCWGFLPQNLGPACNGPGGPKTRLSDSGLCCGVWTPLCGMWSRTEELIGWETAAMGFTQESKLWYVDTARLK